MRIAVQSSVFLPTPASGAGAVELLVAKLCQGLAALGHEVICYCLEGSTVNVQRRVVQAIGSSAAREALISKQIAANRPDVLFDHSLHQLTQRQVPALPVITMCHGMAALSLWARNLAFTSFHHGRLHGFKAPVALHNGIEVEEVPFVPEERREQLAWAGRLIAYKHPEIAVRVAEASDALLVMAGPPAGAVAPAGTSAVVYLGELEHGDLLGLLGSSSCLLFTSDESEPAGIVMLEAQAAGTPVLAFDHGANREFTQPGVTSYLAKSEEKMVQTIKDRFWENIRPEDCRAYVQEHRSIEAMVAKAEKLLTRAALGERW